MPDSTDVHAEKYAVQSDVRSRMNVGVEFRERALDDDGRRDRKSTRPTCFDTTRDLADTRN